MPHLFRNATVILEDRLLTNGDVLVNGERIETVGPAGDVPTDASIIDLAGAYLAPGFIDLHVHGGAGADFMDGTLDAFCTVCRAHARHGTTGILPTTTVARHDQHLAFLDCCRRLMKEGTGITAIGEPGALALGGADSNRLPPGANAPGSPAIADSTLPTISSRILGAHFYGPYFATEARGCHPAAECRPPTQAEYLQYLEFDCINRATVAPELPGAEEFVRACRARGIGCNAGHSYATFAQMRAAVGWGVTHVDHLFCAMSDRARLRQTQTYPMRGGVMEATLFFDELTTEIIADGKHLEPELLLLAYKIKGPDRVALCTDCNRALDMPDGPYIFGPRDGGEPILRQDEVGLMPDGKSLASSVVGMDQMVRTFHRLTGVSLVETVRMASLTPARIAGRDRDLGSIRPGKLADLVVLDKQLNVQQVYVGGHKVE